MTQQATIEYCRNCSNEVTGRYCANCGTSKELRRIDRGYLVSEIGDVLNFDKGILFTVKELFVRPGITVKKFLLEDRNRLVKPLVFLIVTSLIYTFFRQIFNFEDGYIYHDDSQPSTAMSIFGWIQNNYGYGNVIMGLFIAFWIKVFFKKHHFNFYEVLILLCFVMGMGMLVLALFGLIEGLVGIQILDVGSFIFVGYAAWAIGQFFDKKKVGSYLKAFLSYFLGMLTFSIAILVLGALIDAVVKISAG